MFPSIKWLSVLVSRFLSISFHRKNVGFLLMETSPRRPSVQGWEMSSANFIQLDFIQCFYTNFIQCFRWVQRERITTSEKTQRYITSTCYQTGPGAAVKNATIGPLIRTCDPAIPVE